MKILLIEDDFRIIRSLSKILLKNNIDVLHAISYDQAVNVLQDKSFDVILCDYHLGNDEKKTGLDLIKKLREVNVATPVILVTGRPLEEITPWEALDAGVDDFLKKPYKIEELIARLFAVLRRSMNLAGNAGNVIKVNNIELNLKTREIKIGKETKKMSNINFIILSQLLAHRGDVLSYGDLIEYIWGGSALYEGQSSNTLRVHMAHLKALIGKNNAKHIKTINKIGYTWEE